MSRWWFTYAICGVIIGIMFSSGNFDDVGPFVAAWLVLLGLKGSEED